MIDTLTDRFLLRRELGSGSFGVVYEALDTHRDHLVALKLLQKVSGDTLYRFKQEFRSLAGVRHRNLVRLFELLSDGERWFYTMELIHGADLIDHLAGKEIERAFRPPSTIKEPPGAKGKSSSPHSLSEDYIRDLTLALRQLVEGVAALHVAEKLHRDIKPSNILVTNEGRVVLLDFGLIRAIDGAEFDDVWLVGTPGYMSPEQTSGEPLTPASDWYSVGAILYQALTGTLPFSGSFLDIAVAQQARVAEPPSSLVDGVPPFLEQLCLALLERDPSRRPRAEEIRLALGSVDVPLWFPPIRSRSRESDERFVGRERELVLLHEAFERSLEGESECVYLHGASGVGKTALANRFLDRMRSRGGISLFAGRCYEKESVPYKALDDIVDSIVRQLRQDEQKAEPLLPSDLAALQRLFPIFGWIDVVARELAFHPGEAPSGELRQRAVAAFCTLLSNMSREAPLVLFVDDAQWGDFDSADVVAELLARRARVLMLLAYPSDDAQSSVFLERLRSKSGKGVDLRVDPLSFADSRRLGAALTGEEIDSERSATIARESNGLPFLIEELAQYAVAHRVEEISLSDVFKSRLVTLPREARRLLDVVALAGEPLELELALHAAGLELRHGELLSYLRDERLVRSRVTGELEEVEIYHSVIRDLVFRELSSPRQQKVHASLARALEEQRAAEPETLARHFFAAGMLEKAAHYAIRGGDQAFDALAFDRAARLYILALEVSPEVAEEAVRERLGQALENASSS